jgi:hypothetical protein
MSSHYEQREKESSVSWAQTTVGDTIQNVVPSKRTSTKQRMKDNVTDKAQVGTL